MNDAEKDRLLAKLAEDVQAAPGGVGIGMGCELYKECHSRGLIVARTFTINESSAFPTQLSTYDGYYAHADPNLGYWNYKIGREIGV